jgi:phosphatidylinositol 4-kinase A
VWRIDPAIAVALAERFHPATVQNEVTRLVRANTREVMDVPEALRFLVGERLDHRMRRDLKVSRDLHYSFILLLILLF